MKRLFNNTLKYLIATALTLCCAGGCSLKMDSEPAAGSNSDSSGEHEEYVYLYVSVDGRLCFLDSQQQTQHIADINVVLRDASGRRIDSVRTTAYGRFLIEHANVNVGLPRDQHVYIDIIDDRPGIEPRNRFKTTHIIKEITAAPDNIATLSLDEIFLSREEDS